MDSEKLQTMKGDLEHAIDLLGGIINDLKGYEKYNSDIETLELMISAFNCDIDKLEKDIERMLENEELEWKAERLEREREYWNSRL